MHNDAGSELRNSFLPLHPSRFGFGISSDTSKTLRVLLVSCGDCQPKSGSANRQKRVSQLRAVGEPRIELGLCAPKAHILPLYYSPIFVRILSQILLDASSKICEVEVKRELLNGRLHPVLCVKPCKRGIKVFTQAVYRLAVRIQV